MLFTVRAASDAELARKVRALRQLAEETTDDPTAGGADSASPTSPSPRPGGLIDVGEASGKRGDEVTVEVRGHSDRHAMGFACAIGFETQDLEFVRAQFGEVWGSAEENEVLAADARDRNHRFAGNAGPHVVLSIARFDIESTEPGAVGADAGRTLPAVFVPQGTLLALVVFKIRAGATTGRAVPLLNRSRLFGKPKVIAEFMTESGPSVQPELADGAVIVTG